MKKLINFLTLFTSTSTLICCALPALLVALGAGSVMAALVSHLPGLIMVSINKIPIFIFAGIMLTLGGYLQWRNRFEPCPVDSVQAEACMKSRRVSLIIYIVSLSLYLIGGFFAFIAPLFV